MFIREIEKGKVSTYATEIKPGEWVECGWSIIRDNYHRIVKVKKLRKHGCTITIYELI